MTRSEITDHYNRKVRLIEDMAVLEKMRTYLEESKRKLSSDPQGEILIEAMNKEIQDMESNIRKRSDEVASNADKVRAALKVIPDRTNRIAASLHYCNGLSWAEVGAILHCPDGTIRSKVSRAMRSAGISWEK